MVRHSSISPVVVSAAVHSLRNKGLADSLMICWDVDWNKRANIETYHLKQLNVYKYPERVGGRFV